MLEKLGQRWDNLKSSFWLIPGVLMLLAVTAAFLTLTLDHRLDAKLRYNIPLLFSGKPDAARDLLSAIAGSLITVIAVTFSVTIVAVQQASTQYSPRVLSRFIRDRFNQLVLGAYIATFTYSLLVLRSIRSPAEDAGRSSFVPALSVMIALLLAFVSLGFLIYFIHHIISSLQVATILSGIRAELDEEITHLFPEPFKTGGVEPPPYRKSVEETEPLRRGHETRLLAEQDGHIRIIALESLIQKTRNRGIRLFWIERSVGDFVAPGMTLATLWSERELADAEAFRKDLLDCFLIETERTIHQDPLYGIQQIVDVANRALSPAMNDPTTAEECVRQIQGALSKLVAREIPSARKEENGTVYLVRRPDFDAFVECGFSQLRRSARGQVRVTLSALEALAEIAALAPVESRRRAIRAQIERILEESETAADLLPNDRSLLRQKTRAVLERIDRMSVGREAA